MFTETNLRLCHALCAVGFSRDLLGIPAPVAGMTTKHSANNTEDVEGEAQPERSYDSFFSFEHVNN